MTIFSTPAVLSNRRASINDSLNKLGGGNLTRRLTLPLHDPQRIGIPGRRSKQITIEQFGSPLFQLPYELRQEIWRYVLGGNCMAHDTGGFRVGNASNPFPPKELPQNRKLRGLKSLSGMGWEPGRFKRFLSILTTCRQAYSEAIDVLYSGNLFYFRNPLTNWGLSSWRMLPSRLAQIRVLVLDETIGNPSIIFKQSNRKQLDHIWAILSRMSRLKVLYFNVDSLYPKLWYAELEEELLRPLIEHSHISEMHVTIRWTQPDCKNCRSDWFQEESGKHLIRWDSDAMVDEIFKQSLEGDIRLWIIEKVRALERGEL